MRSKWISKEAIVEIGLIRKRGLCAWCEKRMDVPNHNIQLCKSCREESLSSISDYILNGVDDALVSGDEQ